MLDIKLPSAVRALEDKQIYSLHGSLLSLKLRCEHCTSCFAIVSHLPYQNDDTVSACRAGNWWNMSNLGWLTFDLFLSVAQSSVSELIFLYLSYNLFTHDPSFPFNDMKVNKNSVTVTMGTFKR